MPDQTRAQLEQAQTNATRQLAQTELDLADQLQALLGKDDVQALLAFAKANYEPDMMGGAGLNQQLKYLVDMLATVPMSLAHVRANASQALAQMQTSA